MHFQERKKLHKSSVWIEDAVTEIKKNERQVHQGI
jgi:hypothetical protein